MRDWTLEIIKRPDTARGMRTALTVIGGFAILEEAAETIAGYMLNRRAGPISRVWRGPAPAPGGRYRWHWDPRFVTSVMENRDTYSMEDFRARVDDIRVPVHLIRGRMSELVSQEAAQEFMAMLPEVTFTDVGNAGHIVSGD